MKICVASDVLAGYRRRALRRYPREYMETIWGKVRDDRIDVCAFYPVDHTGTRNDCQYYPSDLEAQKDDAEDVKLQMIGTIHSHPDGSSGPSGADIATANTDGDIVSGILQITRRNGRRRTNTLFFVGEIVPVEISKKGLMNVRG